MPHRRLPAACLALLLACGFGGAPFGAPFGAAAHAETPSDPGARDTAALIDALRLPELLAIMQSEGQRHGEGLEADMFPGQGGAPWAAEVTRLYAPERLQPLFAEAFGKALPPEDLAGALAFFRSDLGQRVTELEVEARRALLDPDLEEVARLQLDDMRADQAPRLALIEDFVRAGDLLEENVLSGLNANFAFYRGLARGGALPYAMTQSEMLADVWSQEESIRAESDQWLHAFLVMAYAPLSDADLAAYVAFCESPAGQGLNRALFAGFAAAYEPLSEALGFGVARRLSGSDI